MARASVFITGASGFLGRSVVEALSGSSRVVCLVRKNPANPSQPGSYVSGDIINPKFYAESLKGCDTILHLAAVTGKQAPGEYFRINRDGTEALIREAERAGVRRFIFVSTVAAKFQDLSHYYYAQSKLQAELRVKKSKLRWTIVRPTMIFGRGSPVLAGLAKLAMLPMIPVFGDGKIHVQPVDVDDLARILVAILDDENLDSRVLEIGGAEVLSIESLMLAIRRARTGSEGKVMHLPVGPIAACLGLLEPLMRPVLPVTAGQLASFCNGGTADPDPWVEQRRPDMKTIKEMLSDAA